MGAPRTTRARAPAFENYFGRMPVGFSMAARPVARPRRDHRGNLMGGEQNGTMQAHQMCETLEEKEHRRWLAHRDAVLSANFPTHLDLNGLTVPIFKAGELEALGQKRLKERALNLRDLVEASRTRLFDNLPRLNVYSQPEALIAWMVDGQVALAHALGYEDLDHAAFGVAPSQTGMQPPQPDIRREQPCWSQAGVWNEPKQGSPGMGQPQSFPWSQHGVVHDHELQAGWRQQTPQHDGFSLVPPHMSPGIEAAHIRHRAQASSVVLG